jgi:hypothetical protein
MRPKCGLRAKPDHKRTTDSALRKEARSRTRTDDPFVTWRRGACGCLRLIAHFALSADFTVSDGRALAAVAGCCCPPVAHLEWDLPAIGRATIPLLRRVDVGVARLAATYVHHAAVRIQEVRLLGPCRHCRAHIAMRIAPNGRRQVGKRRR